MTVYTFLYPILGGDSPEKSKRRSGAPRTTPRPGATGCSTARRRPKAWAHCDTARAASATSRSARSTASTARPALVFEDGSAARRRAQRRGDREAARREPRASPEPPRPPRRARLHPVARVLAVDHAAAARRTRPGRRRTSGRSCSASTTQLLEHGARDRDRARPLPCVASCTSQARLTVHIRQQRTAAACGRSSPARGCAAAAPAGRRRCRRMRAPSSAWTVMPSNSWYATLPKSCAA